MTLEVYLSWIEVALWKNGFWFVEDWVLFHFKRKIFAEQLKHFCFQNLGCSWHNENRNITAIQKHLNGDVNVDISPDIFLTFQQWTPFAEFDIQYILKGDCLVN